MSPSRYISSALRRKIAEQGRRRCGYCLHQEAVVGVPMEIDHLFPHALGGGNEESNLWLACSPCNVAKADKVAARDPQTDKIVPLFNPRKQDWADHFQWNQAGTYVIGLTPIGRATVIALRLNRLPAVKAREIWAEVGWHPPKD